MQEQVCIEKHKRINEQLQIHDRRLNDHAKRLDQLSEDSREYKIQIQNLCKDIGNLVTTLRWFIGLMVGAFVSFFFYAVQNGLFK
jgi:DNA repair ATPase RecN